MPHHEEEDGVGYGFVELSWMAWQHIYPLEDECPRHICHLAYYLGVHEVSEANEARCGRHCDGYRVNDKPCIHLHVSAIEQQCDDDA